MSRLALLAALALVVPACSQSGKKPRIPRERIVGEWRSDTLPAADAPGRVHVLVIDAGGRADFTSTYLGRAPIVERGTWDGADTLVRVVVRRDGTGPAASMLFRLRDTLLVLDADTAQWGAAGLQLRRR
jgi:hypothetical protein